eukprot:6214807-Pleurochrysis_carterae.AAC.1
MRSGSCWDPTDSTKRILCLYLTIHFCRQLQGSNSTSTAMRLPLEAAAFATVAAVRERIRAELAASLLHAPDLPQPNRFRDISQRLIDNA